MPETNIKPSRYVLFTLLQLAGMSLILWDALPIYRRLFDLERIGTPVDEWTLWVAVIIIQFGYWFALHETPSAGFPRSVFAGHVVLFVSRLSFIFASSLFALVIYRHPEAFQFRPSKVALFMAVLFSVFCFSRQLETIGNLMNKPANAR